MENYLSEKYLHELATNNQEKYQSKTPYPYIAIDDFFKHEIIEDALESFPKKGELTLYKYDNPLEKKLAFDQIFKLPMPIRQVLAYMNSAPIVTFLEELTGIKGLVPDPYFRGGGIHELEVGGKLDMHIDFNIHPKLDLYRRLNAIIYLNKDWEESYGGALEIWTGHKEGGKHVLDECCDTILPLFNRLVVFNTSEISYHGNPEPVTCPEGRSRKSIALYYYTKEVPISGADKHSTTFIAKPEDVGNVELEKLREKRNQGRLASNV
jgi:Rps23 Pro-64 3,4-dihydroxylase Tpa1-like proline 4-hydroxylase